MRTEDQIKAKLFQLQTVQKQFDTEEIRIQIEILVWVLNQPAGKYHE